MFARSCTWEVPKEIRESALKPDENITWWFEFSNDKEHWWHNDDAPHEFDPTAQYYCVVWIWED